MPVCADCNHQHPNPSEIAACREAHALRCACGNLPPTPTVADLAAPGHTCELCGCYATGSIMAFTATGEGGNGPRPIYLCLPHYVAGILAGEAP